MAQVRVTQPQGLSGWAGPGLRNTMGAWSGTGAGSTPALPSSCLLSSSRCEEPYRTLVFVAGQNSQERKRRQRLRASVFALALPLSLGPGWALWATVPKASGPIQGPQRRLLGSLLQVRLSQLGVGGQRGGLQVPSLLRVPMCVWKENRAGLVFVGRNL